ncbi:MAG: hypothetical protein H6704_03115 [Myxococcales bacterium]|nr:hypothetical protein [Myxococcales bacterium]
MKATFFGLLLATGLVTAALVVLGAPLVTDPAPHGIVSFELAADVHTAQAMLDSWGPEGVPIAARNLGLDALYLLLYPATLALGLWLVGARRLARAMPVAGALDLVENVALLAVLYDGPTPTLTGVAFAAATLKFFLVIWGTLAFGALFVRCLLTRGASPTRRS